MKSYLRWMILASAPMLVLTGCASGGSKPAAQPVASPAAAVTSAALASPAVSSPAVSSPDVAPGSENVSIGLNQWSVTQSAPTGPKGAVTFTVTNTGDVPHEFVVLKTDTLSGAVPVASFEGEANRIDEDTAGTNVGESGDLEPGATKAVTISFKPGHYIFVCNLVGHYAQGMRTDFTF